MEILNRFHLMGQDIQNKKEEERKLTPKDIYILGTPPGRIFRILEKNPDIDQPEIKKHNRRIGRQAINTLKENGIIEVTGKKVTAYHYENIIKLWRDTKGSQILELFNEDQKELTVRQISKSLKASFDNTNDEIHNMVNSGLLEVRMIGKKTRVLYLPGHPKEEIPQISESLIQEETDSTKNFVSNAPEIKNERLEKVIIPSKKSDNIIPTDNLPSKIPTAHTFPEVQLGEEKEQKRELTPNEIKFIHEKTKVGETLNTMKIGTKIKDLRRVYKRSIKELIDDRVIKIEEGEVVDIDLNNLYKIYERTTGSKVRNLLEKDNTLTTRELAIALDKSIYYIRTLKNQLRKYKLL